MSVLTSPPEPVEQHLRNFEAYILSNRPDAVPFVVEHLGYGVCIARYWDGGQSWPTRVTSDGQPEYFVFTVES